MKPIQTLKPAALAAFIMAGGVLAQAQITINTVAVGSAGNAADTTGYGAVGYSYDIGTYEVTNAQYAAFLNAVAATDTFSLYNLQMSSSQFGGITQSGRSGRYTYAVKSGYANKPVNHVSFWDAARFSNWLNNGQGNGSTETGSYTLTSGGISGNTVTRNAGANWVVASENERYKAAYHAPTKNSGAGGYWLYPTQSDTLANNTDFGAANGANYYDGDYVVYTGLNDAALPVGTYANADSFYGTFDQGGNLWEWNEAILTAAGRGLRGGSFFDLETFLASSLRNEISASIESRDIGFRVVRVEASAIPEPSTYGAALGAVTLGVVLMRRRKARGTL